MTLYLVTVTEPLDGRRGAHRKLKSRRYVVEAPEGATANEITATLMEHRPQDLPDGARFDVEPWGSPIVRVNP